MFTEGIIYNSQDMRGKKNGMLFSYKEKEILLFATTWTDLEGIMLSEIRERQVLYYVTYMWNLRKTKQNKKNNHHTSPPPPPQKKNKLIDTGDR